MKKIISLLAAIVFVIGCMALPVSALVSPEVDDVITDVTVEDANGDEVEVELIRLKEVIDELKPESKDEAVISQYTLEVKGDPEYPITFTVKIAGIKTTSKVYLLAKDEDGSIQYIEAKVLANGKIQFTLDKYYSLLSVISDKKTSTQIGTSDKTGDVVTPIVLAVMFASASVAAVSKKKINV